MNANDLRVLLDYHYWARDRMLEAIDRLTPDEYARRIGGSFASVRDTVAHIYAADWIWFSRWQGISPKELVSAEMFPDQASVRRAWRELEEKVRQYFAPLDDNGINREMNYKLLSGVASRSALWHMLQHVVNHGTYHRGQVTTLLRQLGAEPPKGMDLIAYYRELREKA